MAGSASLGLVVRAEPYRQRAARAQLDLALVAAAAESPLRVYFFGPAVMQLVVERDPARSHLPGGYQAWGSIPEMSEIEAFAEPEWLVLVERLGLRLALDVLPLDRAGMRRDWARCTRLLTP